MALRTSERELLDMSQGHKISCKYWNDAHVDTKDLKALVFISHGFGEHCRWYDNLAQLLVDAQCYVFAHDHIGHGESEGMRAQIHDFHQYTVDIFEHIDAVKVKFPDAKVFIIGHSMGGTIAIQAAIERPHYFSGVVLISAGIEFKERVNWLTRATVKLLASVFPQLEIRKIDPKTISRDAEKVKAYQEDPLVWHGGIKAKWLVCFNNAMEDIRRALPTIDWPFFALHGTKDLITNVAGSRKLYEQAKSEDKTLKLYEDYYHQLHSEPEPHRSEVCHEIRDWIMARMLGECGIGS